MKKLHYSISHWPLAKTFVISRGARTQADVIQVMIEENGIQGFGECVPYGRYNETMEGVIKQIESVKDDIINGMDRDQLQTRLNPGAARNALDCALWDLEAKQQGRSVGVLSELGDPNALTSAQTLSIDTPENMAKEATLYSQYPLIKVKLDNKQVMERMRAIKVSAPTSQFIIDANEAWTISELNEYCNELAELSVALIEQPLPARSNKDLVDYKGSVAICADESCHTSQDIPSLVGLYQAINIKLDKTGGLTEAIKTLQAARSHQLIVMVGCMVGTSLAMAPATLIANHADFVDLDGPALLAEDVAHGFQFNQGIMSALDQHLWGGN